MKRVLGNEKRLHRRDTETAEEARRG
jgi:hypothetical protein